MLDTINRNGYLGKVICMSNHSFGHASPLILGHRGASYDAPENTLTAFDLAHTQGADGVELDTSLSKDGIPVVMHDLTLDKTTTGSGLIRNYTLSQLKELDAGSHFSSKFRGERIPTLDEVFALLSGKMFINVELKSSSWLGDGLEAAVLEVLRKHKAESHIIVSSFNPFALRRFHALAPDIPIGYLYAEDKPVYLRQAWLMVGLPHQARHPQHTMINQRYMQWANAHQYQVNTWTVDDPERMVQLRDLGVHAIITNRPDVALKTLRR